METPLESGIFSEEYMNNYEYGEVPFKGCSSKGVIPNNFLFGLHCTQYRYFHRSKEVNRNEGKSSFKPACYTLKGERGEYKGWNSQLAQWRTIIPTVKRALGHFEYIYTVFEINLLFWAPVGCIHF